MFNVSLTESIRFETRKTPFSIIFVFDAVINYNYSSDGSNKFEKLTVKSDGRASLEVFRRTNRYYIYLLLIESL